MISSLVLLAGEFLNAWLAHRFIIHMAFPLAINDIVMRAEHFECVGMGNFIIETPLPACRF